MKLMTLHIQNFKRLQSLDLELNGKSTVFSGINGVGKSTVLSAINYLMWPALNRLNNAQGTAFRSLSADMVHTGQQSLHLSAEFALDGQTLPLQRDYTAPLPGKPARSNNQKEMYDGFIGAFVSAYLSGQEDSNMPVFVTYGTNRSVLDIPLRIRNRHEFSQVAALERASESSLDFRTFFEWFRNQEDLENEIKTESRNLDYEDLSLKCVRKAVCAMPNGVSDLRVKRSPLRMTVNKEGAEFRVDELSDGENFDEAQRILEQLRAVVAPDDPELTGCEVRLDLEMR